MAKSKKIYHNLDEIVEDVDKGTIVHYFNNAHFVYKKNNFGNKEYYICRGNKIIKPLNDFKTNINLFYSLEK